MYTSYPDNPTIGEEWRVSCQRHDEQEYWQNEERRMCRSILAKVLFTYDGNTLARANLDNCEKEFLIDYDFLRLCFRKFVKSRQAES